MGPFGDVRRGPRDPSRRNAVPHGQLEYPGVHDAGAKVRQAHHQLGAIGELLVVIDEAHLGCERDGVGCLAHPGVTAFPFRAPNRDRGSQEILFREREDEVQLPAAGDDRFGDQHIRPAGEGAIGDRRARFVEDCSDGLGNVVFRLPPGPEHVAAEVNDWRRPDRGRQVALLILGRR